MIEAQRTNTINQNVHGVGGVGCRQETSSTGSMEPYGIADKTTCKEEERSSSGAVL